MKIGFIMPISHTGEYTYGTYLIEGLKKKENLDVDVLHNPLFDRPNIKISFGSLILKKLLMKKKVNIIHNLDNLGPYLFKYNAIKSVSTIHDICPIILPSLSSPIMRIDFKLILPVLIKNSDYIIVPSHSTKNDLVSRLNIKSNKIEIIPHGIDQSIFFPRKRDAAVLKKYGIKNKYMLYVGSNSPRKNLINLILAFIKIYIYIPHSLILVGPIRKSEILKLIKNNLDSQGYREIQDRIIITGYMDLGDLPLIFSNATAFLFPSLYEGFGIPLLEAMSCGCPVVVSENSSMVEVVDSSGVYIRNPLSPDDIANSIMKVISDEDLQEEMRTRGLKQARKFSWQKTVDSTLEVYTKIYRS
jgi:glycosyltransferase involved in cell wall biosynthesis